MALRWLQYVQYARAFLHHRVHFFVLSRAWSVFFSFQNTVLILGEIPQLNTNQCEQWPLTSGNARTAFIQAHSLQPTAASTKTIYRKDNILIDDFHFAYVTNGLGAVLSYILELTWKIHTKWRIYLCQERPVGRPELACILCVPDICGCCVRERSVWRIVMFLN